MLHIMLSEGLVDLGYVERHTQGFADLRLIVRDFTPEVAAKAGGIPVEDLIQAARWFGDSTATLSLYCQGLNQSSRGTDKNAALINLHLATGQIGKPGAGPFSLTGQPNAMGGREVGGMANLPSAPRDLGNADHRPGVARPWGGSDEPAEPGMAAVGEVDAAGNPPAARHRGPPDARPPRFPPAQTRRRNGCPRRRGYVLRGRPGDRCGGPDRTPPVAPT